MSSWYETGYSGIRKEQERIDQMSGPNRLWIPEGATKEVVFVDDEPACIYEHNPKVDGNWRHWYTCLKGVYDDDIACCALLNPSGYKAYYVGFYTIIDCSEWVDKKGNKYQYEVKFFPAKLKTLKRLQLRKQDNKSFAGKLFKITRLDSKSPSCGDEMEILRDVDMAKLFTLANYRGKQLTDLFSKGTDADNIERLRTTWQVDVADGKVVQKLVPFNYAKLLHPLPPKEMRSVLGGATIEKRDGSGGGGDGGDAGGGGGKADGDVPF